MRYQTQIVPDQSVPRLRSLRSAFRQGGKGSFFFGRRQRPWKGTALQMQCQIQNMPGRSL